MGKYMEIHYFEAVLGVGAWRAEETADWISIVGPYPFSPLSVEVMTGPGGQLLIFFFVIFHFSFFVFLFPGERILDEVGAGRGVP